jgi:hypothetical protein
MEIKSLPSTDISAHFIEDPSTDEIVNGMLPSISNNLCVYSDNLKKLFMFLHKIIF